MTRYDLIEQKHHALIISANKRVLKRMEKSKENIVNYYNVSECKKFKEYHEIEKDYKHKTISDIKKILTKVTKQVLVPNFL
jgi:hypothetical protein